ncbi:MAG: hypothetical protein U0610_24555 [bacterium]
MTSPWAAALALEVLVGLPGVPLAALLARAPSASERRSLARQPEALVWGLVLGRFLTAGALILAVARFGPSARAVAVAAALLVLATVALWRAARADDTPGAARFRPWSARTWLGAAVLLGAIALLAGGPLARVGARVDDAFAYHRYFPGDFLKQVAMTSELTKGELPPHNPWLAGVPLHYYWASFVPAALVHRVLRAEPSLERLLVLETLWTDALFGLALFATVRLVTSRERWAVLGTLAALGAVSYEGAYFWARHPGSPAALLAAARSVNIDGLTRVMWGPPQIDALHRALVYGPPHLLALTCGLLLVALVTAGDVTARTRVAVGAGAVAAASVAASFFVGGVVTLWLALVTGLDVLRPRADRAARIARLASALAIVAATAGACVALAMVARSREHGLVLGLPSGLRERPLWVLGLNLGGSLALGGVGIVCTRREEWRDCWPVLALVVLALAVLALLTLPGYANDVALKAGFVVQVGLAVFAASALERFAPRGQRALGTGVLAVLALPAALTPLLDWRFTRAVSDHGQTCYVSADAMELARRIRETVPERAVVQARPLDESMPLSVVPVFGERRSVLGDRFFARIFQAPADKLAARERDLGRLFGVREPEAIRGLLARYDIDYLVLGTEDGALRDYCAASLDTCELTFRNATYDLVRIRRPQPQPRA